MEIIGIPFGVTDWSEIAATIHPGDSGTAYWRSQTFGDVRVRMVRYSAGYVADHWCNRGHILLVLEGTLMTELDDGSSVVITAGSSYQVANNTQPHRSHTVDGALLFVVD